MPLTGNPYFGNMVTMKKERVRPARGSTVSETNKWEKILAAEGLSMDAGRDPGHRKLLCVGNASDLEGIHEMLVGQNGRVRPKGSGPDDDREADNR